MSEVVYRVGEGQSPSGKILDRGTCWYTNLEEAYKYASRTGKKIYVSYNKSRYRTL